MKDLFTLAAITVLALSGCATNGAKAPAAGALFRDAANPAWSINLRFEEPAVSVSPASKSIGAIHSSVFLVSKLVDETVNARYRDTMRRQLEGYDPAERFETYLAARLEEALGQVPDQNRPLTSASGYNHLYEAREAFLEAVEQSGADALLETKAQCGLYGTGGKAGVRLDAVMYRFPGGRRAWSDTLHVFSGPVLAYDRLRNPMKGGPDLKAGLTVDEEALSRWVGDPDGTVLRGMFEEVITGSVAALLVELELADDAAGHYHLGKLMMYQKKFKAADSHFANALAHDPSHLDARNARAVNLAHNGQIDAAIDVAQALAADAPDYGPVHLNLAWWTADKTGDTRAATAYYEKALSLGMPRASKLQKLLGE